MIEEEVYIERTQVFEVEDKVNHVSRLKKALYGLKQAPRAWYSRIYSVLNGNEKQITGCKKKPAE